MRDIRVGSLWRTRVDSISLPIYAEPDMDLVSSTALCSDTAFVVLESKSSEWTTWLRICAKSGYGWVLVWNNVSDIEMVCP